MSSDQQLSSSVLQACFDAFPSPVFLVDENLWVLDFNVAAARRYSLTKSSRLQCRIGDVQHCARVGDSPLGCGQNASCQRCPTLDSVRMALRGKPVVRQFQSLEIAQWGRISKHDAFVTATAIEFAERPAVLVVVEDMNETARWQEQRQDRWSQCVATRPSVAPAAQFPCLPRKQTTRLDRSVTAR